MLQLTDGSFFLDSPDPDFRSDFQILYERAPIRGIKLFFCYLKACGVDAVAEQMAFWVTAGTLYVQVLIELSGSKEADIPAGLAENIIGLLPDVDPQFLIKLTRTVAGLTDARLILNALRLLPALGDYGILIPWLRSLEEQSDPRLRASAAKLLCLLRPHRRVIQRHLQSPDPRVRAGVMEALWKSKIVVADSSLLQALRNGAADPNHRVVANALVGLYRLGDGEALARMIALCTLKQHLFRAAMAWAMGVVDDSRAVSPLQVLTHDPSFTVRSRATQSLLTLGYAVDDDGYHDLSLYSAKVK